MTQRRFSRMECVAGSARESLRAWSPLRDVGQSSLTRVSFSFSRCALSRAGGWRYCISFRVVRRLPDEIIR